MEEENNLLNDVLYGTAASAVGGTALAGAIIAERARRLSNSTGTSYRDALVKVGNDMADDALSAMDVIRGKSPYDLDVRNNANTTASMREYANSASADPRFSAQPPAQGSYIKNPLTQMAVSARDAFVPSSEDFLGFRREERLKRGVSPEGPKSDTVFSRIPLVDAYKDLAPERLGGFNEQERLHRAATGIDLMKGNPYQAAGGLLGRSAADFINNGARSVWWLLNAPQAVADVASEALTGVANREGLYGLDYALESDAKKRGWIDKDGTPKNSSINPVRYDFKVQEKNDPQLMRRVSELMSEKGQTGNKLYSKRRVGANLSTLLALPAAVAINSGLGLNTVGGGDGRKAVFPDEENPQETQNAIAEVAAKYILGRQGDLLPWDEYKQVRPDVTQDEYRAYKAYRYSKQPDYNYFDDGKINILNGVIKANDDGIDGGEIMFLGRSMPIATTVAPTVAGVVGAGLGAALAQHGGLNIDGIQEGIKRRQTELDSIERDLSPTTEPNESTQTKLNRSDSLKKEIAGKQKMKNWMETGPASRVFTNPRLRNSGVITAGLAGGAGLSALTSLIGGEAERRRREYEAEQGI